MDVAPAPALATGSRPLAVGGQPFSDAIRPVAPIAGRLTAALSIVFLVCGSALRRVWDEHPLFAVVPVAVALSLVAAGVALTATRRSAVAGWWMTAAGIIWPLTALAVNDNGIGPYVSWVSSGLVWIPLLLAILSYPADLPRTPWERVFLVLIAVSFGPGTWAAGAISRPEWSGLSAASWWPTVYASQAAFTVVSGVLGVLDLLTAFACIVLVVRRMRHMSAIERSSLWPAVGAVAVLALVSGASSAGENVLLTREAWHTALFVQGLGLLLLPVAVLAALFRNRAMRASLAVLVQRLSASTTTAEVQQTLREALRDDTVEVRYWVEGHGAYEPGVAGERLVVHLATADGAPLALVSADPRLRPYADFVAAAVTSAGFVLENTRLQEELRARIVEVEQSRALIVGAQRDERERIAGDLHDTLQQSLLSIAARARATHDDLPDSRARTEVHALAAAALDAVEQVRQVSRGLYSPLLRSHGLLAALEEVTDHLDLDVDLEVAVPIRSELGKDVAYLWVCEALANVVKHARAEHAWVSVGSDGDDIVIEVRDDGIGGVDEGRDALRALRRRAAIAEGVVQVDSPAGRGTTVSLRMAGALGAES